MPSYARVAVPVQHVATSPGADSLGQEVKRRGGSIPFQSKFGQELYGREGGQVDSGVNI